MLFRSSGGSRHSRLASVPCLVAPALAVLAALSALALLALLARSLVSRASRSMIARFAGIGSCRRTKKNCIHVSVNFFANLPNFQKNKPKKENVNKSHDINSEDIKINGITLGTVNTIRDFQIQDPTINSLSKHNCIAACIEADKLGVDEGLMLDPYGYVSTCNSTNFFIVCSGEVWTSTGKYCLNGITRGSVINLCKKYKIPVFEKNFSIEDVHIADEVFVTGTFAGIIPVPRVDGCIIGDGLRGELTKKLQGWYTKDIEKLVNTN